MKKLTSISLLAIVFLLQACNVFKQADVMPVPADTQEEHIGKVYSLLINDGVESFETWYSDSCIEVSEAAENGTLQLKWDKIAGGCKWLGMGFGWDAWLGKDLSSILNSAAIMLKVKMVEKPGTNLPVAFALEDYAGGQAWLGYSNNALRGERKIIDTAWTEVILPIAEFDWSEGADPNNIKQLIIQFETNGNIILDEIRIVPFKGSYKKLAIAYLGMPSPKIDGELTEFSATKPSLSFEGSSFYIASNDKDFIFAGNVIDQTPLNNSRSNEDIWNGDAIEIAFSTDPNAPKKRKRYLSTDQQIGIKISDGEPFIWHWKKKAAINNSQFALKRTNNGYSFECTIPMSEFGIDGFYEDVLYGLEVAIDDAGKDGKRQKQTRWNNPEQSEFHQNPSVWGEMMFQGIELPRP